MRKTKSLYFNSPPKQTATVSLETKPLSRFFFSIREDFELTAVWHVLNPLKATSFMWKTLRSNGV